MILINEWENRKEGWRKLKNHGKTFYIKQAEEIIRQVERDRKKYNAHYKRNEMVWCVTTVNLNEL